MTRLLALALALALSACVGPPSPALHELELGEECASYEFACGPGLECIEEYADATPIEHGFCTESCSFTDTGDTCADGERCLNYRPSGDRFCYEAGCSIDIDCRDGWLCLHLAIGDTACIPDNR